MRIARTVALAALAAGLLNPLGAPPAAADDAPSIRTIAGGVPEGIPATSVALTPSDVDATPTGDLLIADAGAGIIWRRTPDGRVQHVAGSGRLCMPSPVTCYGDGGPAREAFLHSPAAVLEAPDGDVYVAEQRGDRVRRIDAETGLIHPFAGDGSREHDDAAMGGLAVE
ncbi:MAG TPA: hypothetical protein VHH14_08820, partial [Solirubrobacterales bacterium]|nr:hypothetical protein [Solirubrobacterales bacterium]